MRAARERKGGRLGKSEQGGVREVGYRVRRVGLVVGTVVGSKHDSVYRAWGGRRCCWVAEIVGERVWGRALGQVQSQQKVAGFIGGGNGQNQRFFHCPRRIGIL